MRTVARNSSFKRLTLPRLHARCVRFKQAHVLESHSRELAAMLIAVLTSRKVNVVLITLDLDRADDSAHHRHRHRPSMVRTQTVIGTNYDAAGF